MARKREGNERGGNGRFAYEGLDRVLHEKARLGILTSLVAHPDGLRFGELRTLCALTDGNLSRHLDVLREAGLVEVWKGFEERRPQTLARLSTGRTPPLHRLSRRARTRRARRAAEGGERAGAVEAAAAGMATGVDRAIGWASQ